MYYQNYEDYMRSILGYPVKASGYMGTYENGSINSIANTEYSYQTPRYSNEIMNLYPEIYKILNPMICKICEANTKPISRELIENMTDEIYLNIESDPTLLENEVINVRVNLPNNNTKPSNTSTTKSKTVAAESTSKKIRDNRNENKVEEKKVIDSNGNRENSENRENRQRNRNNTLRDLIKILILNQLLGGNIRPPRPNPPPRPPRPPYPGNPGPRPPIQPRYF